MDIGSKRAISVVAVGGMLIGFVAMASADLRAAQLQLNTAAKEAARAAISKDTGAVHRHLQRLINCLVGTEGEEFDLDVGNPCAGQESGAMQGLQPVPEIQMLVEQALGLAKTGLMIEAIGPAQDTAQAARKILTRASQEVIEVQREALGRNH
jgi:hypothetical protein